MGSCNNERNSFWALDMWDKIGISIILITFAIFSISSCFATTSSFIPVNDLVQYESGNDILLGYTPNRYGFAISIKKGHTYKFTNNMETNLIHISFPKEFPEPGVECYDYGENVLAGHSIEFSRNSDGYIYIFFYSIAGYQLLLSDFSFEDVTPYNGMRLAVFDLTQNITSVDLWNTFRTAIPYISVVVLVAFGFYLIFHAIREVSKGRDV